MSEFRLYAVDELGSDGYPPEWHATIKHVVREQTGHRCVCCGHPYRSGNHGSGEWSPCDEECRHGGPYSWSWAHSGNAVSGGYQEIRGVHAGESAGALVREGARVEAKWRILTVHHLDGRKANCRWWNLIACCQRCHLWLQGTVKIEQVYPFEHDEYFKPYAAGYYAFAYLGEDLDRPAVEARLDELLALERVA